jgi:adenylate kinase
MMKPTVVGLFGLSGVGKGWIAHHVCAKRPEILHLEASSLMRRALSASSEALRTAAPAKMADNQIRLIAAFEAERAEHPTRPVLFDGHSVIDNDRALIEIPVAVVSGLRLDQIVFVWDAPETIAARRETDTRPRPKRSLVELQEHQERARSVASAYGLALGIPFVEVHAGAWPVVAGMYDATPHTAAFR